jgi:selenocysteine lyase/cysteine desulfurase
MPEFASAAERYEGYFPAMPLYYAMEQSVDLFLKLGTARIDARVLELASKLREKVEALGGSVEHTNTPILACRFPQIDSNQLASQLQARKIIVSARHGLLRVSVHIYNNQGDLDLFAEGVSKSLA